MPDRGPFATYPSLRDRVVVITGGASGIGEALVEAFSAQGSRVIFLDIQDAAAEALTSKIAAAGFPTPAYFHCDLTDIAALQNTMREVLLQNPIIDVLINNAGNDTRHKIEDVTSEFWDRTMAVNLKQQFFMAQAVIPAMKRTQRGSILNMSSIGWMIPSMNVAVYATAKAAIVGLTRTLAHELGANNIRVNSILPGAILTERQKQLWFTEEYKAEILASQALQRMLLPEEVARLALFLAADDSSAITSQAYIIDGGWV